MPSRLYLAPLATLLSVYQQSVYQQRRLYQQGTTRDTRAVLTLQENDLMANKDRSVRK